MHKFLVMFILDSPLFIVSERADGCWPIWSIMDILASAGNATEV
jgi:hypothetical protein